MLFGNKGDCKEAVNDEAIDRINLYRRRKNVLTIMAKSGEQRKDVINRQNANFVARK
jgi:hypothetical protein